MDHILNRQRQEVSELESRLAQVKGIGPSHPEAFHAAYFQETVADAQARQFAEIASIEEELSAVKTSPTAAWLRGPVTSIEHELARRRHLAKVQELEAKLAAAQRCLNPSEQTWGRGADAYATLSASNGDTAWGKPPSARKPTMAWHVPELRTPEVIGPARGRRRTTSPLWRADVPAVG